MFQKPFEAFFICECTKGFRNILKSWLKRLHVVSGIWI